MSENYMSCCFTGYRPQKFPFALDRKNPEYIKFENLLYNTVFDLIESGCRTFYSGMAAGFDIMAAEAVLEAKKFEKYADVSLICAIPYLEQARHFEEDWKNRYETVLENSDKTVLLSDCYYRGCFLKRNRYMVESSDCVLTYFDGTAGGTKSTVNYAKRVGRGVINLYDRSLCNLIFYGCKCRINIL